MRIEVIESKHRIRVECSECHERIVLQDMEADDEDYIVSFMECECDWAAFHGLWFCDRCKEKEDIKHWMASWSRLDRRLFEVTPDGEEV